MRQVGERLRAARKAAGFKTAKSFSLKHGIPPVTYSQYETGKRNINIDTLNRYCKLLDINCNWLVMGKGSPFLKNNATEKINSLSQELRHSASEHEVDYLEKFEIIKRPVALVDITILGKIIENLLDAFVVRSLPIFHHEVLDFVIDVYNDVIRTTGNHLEKDNIIKLSISSLKTKVDRNAKVAK